MSFLDSVQLAYTCPLAWEKLLGNDQKRFCMDCQKHVTNLSAMTRGQAERYLHANADAPICVRVEVDAKGRAVHRPGLSAAAAMALTLGAVACGGDDDSADSSAGRADASSTSVIPEVHDASTMGQVPVIRQMMGEPPAVTTVPEPLERPHVLMGAPPAPPTHATMGRPATVTMGKIRREPEPAPTEAVMGLK